MNKSSAKIAVVSDLNKAERRFFLFVWWNFSLFSAVLLRFFLSITAMRRLFSAVHRRKSAACVLIARAFRRRSPSRPGDSGLRRKL